MNSTDPYAMLFVQLAIMLFTIFAAFKNFWIRNKPTEATAEAIRGEKSMAALYSVYGATIVSCFFLIDEASCLDGNKVALIVIDFLCVTYVFFFNTWFRNYVFFPLLQRIQKD